MAMSSISVLICTRWARSATGCSQACTPFRLARWLSYRSYGERGRRPQRSACALICLKFPLRSMPGLIPFELCTALAEGSGAEVFDALQSLVAQGVLSVAGDAYRFAREPVRQLLLVELSEQRKQRAHAISGEYLLAATQLSALDRLRAGLHLVLGGDVERGSEHVALAAKHYGLVDLADVGQAAPTLERALSELRALGRPEPELLTLYAPLALAGYYFERHYSDRYADHTVALLERLLGLSRARRMQAFLGKRLGLWLSLGWSALQFSRWSKNGRAPTFREAMMLLFYCVAASTGVSAVCIDPQRALHFANVLAPLRALGDRAVNEETVTTADLAVEHDHDRTVVAGRSYRLLPLITSPSTESRVVGALLISDDPAIAIPATVLHAMADRLLSALAESH
jgi:hypothetical protein